MLFRSEMFPLAGTFPHLAVVVTVPGTSRTYWLAYRYTPTSTRLGVILMRAEPDYSSTLINFHSNTSSCSDVTIPVGATLVDQGFRVTPIGLGGTAPNFWIQVQIEFN